MEKENKRNDDQDINIIKNRMNVYKLQTEPIKEYYRKQGKLKIIDGSGSEDDVFDRLCSVIDSYKKFDLDKLKLKQINTWKKKS